ncbi:hypothetical protein ACE6H2_007462 [Prunus campanulata]
MPVEADASVWRALLNACRLHSAKNLAGTIFEKLVELEPMNAGNYVLISNLYAAAGLWMEVRQIRTRLREKGLERPPARKSGMKMDASLGNTSLSMYAEFNCVESVQKVFAEMKYSDVVSWNTLIRALACNGLQDEAWKIFGVMRESDTKPNSHTIISILATCEDETCIKYSASNSWFCDKTWWLTYL